MLREEGLATEHLLQDEICELQKELGEAREKISELEEDNKMFMLSAATYRMQWINAERTAQLLTNEAIAGPPCLSQAEWTSSSPVRSYGMCF